MPFDSGYVWNNRSAFYKALGDYFRGRGVTSDRKVCELTYRWIRRKGYRLPHDS